MTHIIINEELCIRCGQCVHHCPFDTLRINADGSIRQAYPDDCLGMMLCVRYCPANAISRGKGER